MANHRSELVLERLSPQARIRFQQCVSGQAVPRPLWFLPVAKDWSWKFLLPSGALLFLVMLLVGGGKEMEWPWITGWFLAVALLAGGVIGWLRLRKHTSRVGAPPGVYLFASDLIEIRHGVCALYDLDDLTEVRPQPAHDGTAMSELAFVFGRDIVAIRVPGKQTAQMTASKFWPAREELLAALGAGEWDQVSARDPLYEARYFSQWDNVRDFPPLMAPGPVVIDGNSGSGFLGVPTAVMTWAVIVAAVVAPVLWWGDNLLRDALAFSRAESRDTVASWSTYMKRDQARRYLEASQERLPRAALRAAKKEGTATALRAFLAKYGQTSLAAEARGQLQVIYDQARVRAIAEAKEPARAALGNVLKWLHEHESNVLEVRFGSSSEAEMKGIDDFIQELQAERRLRVPIAPIGPSLAASVVTRREDELVEAMQAGFATYLNPDVLRVTKGGTFAGLVKALDQPSLTVTCYTVPTPQVFADGESRQMFLGIAFNVEFNLYVPGSEPYTSSFQVGFSDKIPKTRGKDNIYDGMLIYTFEETIARIADDLFPKHRPERRMTLMDVEPLVPGGGPRPPGAPAVSGPISTATGFCISPDGYIATARHFTNSARTYKVVTKNGKVEARLVMADPAYDLAILKMDAPSIGIIPVRPSESVKLGESIATIGFPQTQLQGREPKVGKGEIASLSGMRDDPATFQVSVPLQPGNSGGPLLDLRGNAVGVVVGVLRQSQAVNYAVKSSNLLGLCRQIPELRGLAPIKEGAVPAFEDMIENVRGGTVLIEGYP